jgi:hypothetical protein
MEMHVLVTNILARMNVMSRWKLSMNFSKYSRLKFIAIMESVCLSEKGNSECGRPK